MTSSDLQYWIQHPERMDKNTLKELRVMKEQYPYFQSVRLLYLKNLYLLHDETFGDELRKSVLFVADRRVLFRLIESIHRVPLDGNAVLPSDEEPRVDRTLALIDSFLATMPEKKHPEQIALDYTMDYMAYLSHEENESANAHDDTPKLKGQELIDSFIQESESTGGQLASPKFETENVDSNQISQAREPVGELDDTYFTETLAKIYIKQHRYEKAIEIIKKLSLNFPKKSAYFADQIRKLEQIIINTKSE